MKTIILYYSNHHGNTKKLVDAIAASDPENVELLDVTKAGPRDLSGYPATCPAMTGSASLPAFTQAALASPS